MTNLPFQIPAEYWQNFSITPRDIEFLQNFLFDIETPQNSTVLINAVIKERIKVERENHAVSQKNFGEIYYPKDTFKIGQKLIFLALGMKNGIVTDVRKGNNPDIGEFDVIEVKFEDNTIQHFASSLSDHILNLPPEEKTDPQSDPDTIIDLYGPLLEKKLYKSLHADENLVHIAGYWFPRALLIDINKGYLNLAEAILEMNNGEPLSTAQLMEQMEVPLDSNKILTEFSVNFALQDDGRFDEVGPAGEVQWCLKRLEPDEVRNVPAILNYVPVDYDRSLLDSQMLAFEAQLDDELSETEHKTQKSQETVITVTYPHWRTGTLPISSRIEAFFPTAFYTPRIRFSIVDGKSGEVIPAWVVREYGYVFGLKKWYEKHKLIPGSLIVVRKSKNPGEVILEARTHRPNRDWIRTVLAGTDGALVYAVLKQEIACEYNTRMAIMVPDVSAVDAAFLHTAKSRPSFEKLVINTLRELSKLTPQGHVHVEELYSAVNILRRVPPAPLLALLASSDKFVHVGDLHYRLADLPMEVE